MNYQDHIPDDNLNKGGRSTLMVIDTCNKKKNYMTRTDVKNKRFQCFNLINQHLKKVYEMMTVYCSNHIIHFCQ